MIFIESIGNIVIGDFFGFNTIKTTSPPVAVRVPKRNFRLVIVRLLTIRVREDNNAIV